jgi:repressor of nif and glnA expression
MIAIEPEHMSNVSDHVELHYDPVELHIYKGNTSVYSIICVFKGGIMASMEYRKNCIGVFRKLKIIVVFLK